MSITTTPTIEVTPASIPSTTTEKPDSTDEVLILRNRFATIINGLRLGKNYKGDLLREFHKVGNQLKQRDSTFKLEEVRREIKQLLLRAKATTITPTSGKEVRATRKRKNSKLKSTIQAARHLKPKRQHLQSESEGDGSDTLVINASPRSTPTPPTSPIPNPHFVQLGNLTTSEAGNYLKKAKRSLDLWQHIQSLRETADTANCKQSKNGRPSLKSTFVRVPDGKDGTYYTYNSYPPPTSGDTPSTQPDLSSAAPDSETTVRHPPTLSLHEKFGTYSPKLPLSTEHVIPVRRQAQLSEIRASFHQLTLNIMNNQYRVAVRARAVDPNSKAAGRLTKVLLSNVSLETKNAKFTFSGEFTGPPDEMVPFYYSEPTIDGFYINYCAYLERSSTPRFSNLSPPPPPPSSCSVYSATSQEADTASTPTATPSGLYESKPDSSQAPLVPPHRHPVGEGHRPAA